MESKVSVIIPVYNGGKYVGKCIQSVLDQSYKNLEIIVIDDGSTDDSGNICNSFKDKRMHVYHTGNFGVSGARNKGVSFATGDYVTFVDADDTIDKEYIKELVFAADKSKALIIDKTDTIVSDSNISGYFYLENSILNENTHVWGKLYNRKLLTDSGVSFSGNLTIGEDMLYLVELALNIGIKESIFVISKRGYNYTDNEMGAMKSKYKETYLDQLRCWEAAEYELVKKGPYVSTEAFSKIGTIQIMASFLVLGKVSLSDDITEWQQRDALSMVDETITHARTMTGAVGRLSFGYKVKLMLYLISPQLYLKLYRSWKK
ncbi:MAG: glycosyltransferase [Butyrivibrio sp.]|nr:glycosyltransferase [Butyrivibrio sp.]